MTQSLELDLIPEDNERLANLCGPFNKHLQMIESRLGVEINNRNHHFQLIGQENNCQLVIKILQGLYEEAEKDLLSPSTVNLFLQESGIEQILTQQDLPLKTNSNDQQKLDQQHLDQYSLQLRKATIKGRGPNQSEYLRNIQTHDLNLGIGPAGTGKTYLAVACAVEALETEKVRRLVLVRPAVEAGERLGFLPGDLAQKIDPYLRPMYDALYEMLGFERVGKLIERHVIEVAPLAYMRGRTLNDAFIILDEAQNTTREQMKMFLTRIGFGSTAVVTGDITQVDLPRETKSGLRHAIEVLKDVDGVATTFFTARDVVRHPLVQRIVTAYEEIEKKTDG
jgi:phosphate starvation-inducible protein PhoH and related proteins